MKKFLPLLALLALFCACKEEDQPGGDGPDNGGNGGGNNQPGVELTLSANKMAFSSYKGEQVVEVTTNQQSWTADVAQDSREWLSIATEDKTIKVSVSENAEAAERQGIVSVKAGGNTVTLTVTQDGSGDNAADGEETRIEYTLAEGTTIAPAALAPYISSIDRNAHTFIIGKDVPLELLPPAKGNLIVNTPSRVLPDGLLANVRSIEQTADGYKVSYSDLTLEQAFQSLDFNTDGLDIAPYVTDIVDADGNPVEFSTTKAVTSKEFVIDIPPSVSLSFINGLTVSPKMKAIILLKMQLILEDYRVSTLDLKVDSTIDLGAEVEMDLAGIDVVDVYKRLFSFYLAPIPVGPILLTPSIDIYGILNVNGKISLTADVNTEVRAMAYLHYDQIGGLGTRFECSDPVIDDASFKGGAKLEASFSFGLGVGPSMGIFGEVVRTGITLNGKNKWALSAPINLQSQSLGIAWEDAELATTIDVDLSAHYSAIGITEQSEKSETQSFLLKKYKVFPPIDKNIECRQVSGSEFTLRTLLKGPSLLSGIKGSSGGELVVYYYDYSTSTSGRPVIFNFDIDERTVDDLWKYPDKYPVIEANVTGLEQGKQYKFTVGWKYGNELLPMVELPDVMALSTKHLTALHGILDDIRSCASGTWEGCNWAEDYLPINTLANVSIDPNSNDGETFINITIPENWKLGNNLNVKNHIDDEKFEWVLNMEGVRKFQSISILDKRCLIGYQDNLETGNLVFRGISPSNVKTTGTWDVSGSGISYIGDSYFPNYCPETILADNCPNLKGISVTVPKGYNLNGFSASNTAVKESMIITVRGSISAQAMAGMASVGCPLRSLHVYNPDMSSITIGNDGPVDVCIQDINTVSVSGASSLRGLYLGPGVSSLSVSGCPALTTLKTTESFEYSSSQYILSSFDISGVPAIKHLDVGGQRLTGLVPSLFDYMKEHNLDISYTPRYDYKKVSWSDELPDGSGEGWHRCFVRYETWVDDYGTTQTSDNIDFSIWWHYSNPDQWGYYYSGEPSRGYHDKKLWTE